MSGGVGHSHRCPKRMSRSSTESAAATGFRVLSGSQVADCSGSIVAGDSLAAGPRPGGYPTAWDGPQRPDSSAGPSAERYRRRGIPRTMTYSPTTATTALNTKFRARLRSASRPAARTPR